MQARLSYLKEYKIAVVGGGGTGKTALTTQFTQNHFVDEYDPAIDASDRKHCVIDDGVVFLDVLDTNEEFTAVRGPYMHTIDGALLVYSITSRSSFEEISSFNEQILRVKGKDSFPVIIVANKCDWDYERQIGMDEGHDLAKQLNCKFIETSAKLRINVDEAFYDLIREIRRYNKEQQTGHPSTPSQPGASNSPSSSNESTRCRGGCVVV